MLGKAMVARRSLQSFCGRLSWASTVLTRIRWAASVLFAVLRSVEADVATGVEEQRRQRRRDPRKKDHLVHTSRCSLALVFIVALFSRLPSGQPEMPR